MNKIYPVIITIEKDSFLASIPAFDCDTEGATIDEAIFMAKDAIGMMSLGYEDLKKPLPETGDLNPKHNENEFVALIDIDFEKYKRQNDKKVVRKNCTIPHWLNEIAEENGINFSQTLQAAIKEQLRL